MIKEIIDKLNISGKLIYLSQYGSHLYGLNTENSDLDFRGIYIPTLDDIILHKDKDEINEEVTLWEIRDSNRENPTYYIEEPKVLINSWYVREVKVDIKIFSLQKFIQLCSKADTNALDLLFSIECNLVEKYIDYKVNVLDSIMWNIFINRNKLINTDRLESPITYAFKQAEKYSIKGTRYKIMQDILVTINRILFNDYGMPIHENKNLQIKDCIKEFECFFDNKHVKIDELDNKGKLEKYLYICGVQHQFNLEIVKFKERLEEKINKEYTSQRTKQAADGNDWKALSHAIRILLEVKQLLEDGIITFPCIENIFLLRIKQGKISREVIDEFFNKELSNILEKVQSNELNWSYDEEFWNDFILSEIDKI